MKLDGRNILMVAPGMYDFGEFKQSNNHQFGMFRAAAWLKHEGYNVSYVEGGLPPHVDPFFHRLKDRHSGVPVKVMDCGRPEDPIKKYQVYYGRPMRMIRNDMSQAPAPDEVWIGSGLTYHWESTAELVQVARQMFPGVRVRVGGIYPSLCGDHARARCAGADVFEGEIPDAQDFWPDYDILPYRLPFRTVKWNTGCTVSVQCSFCSVKTLEPKFKWRSAESLEDYIEREMHKGVRAIMIWASQLLQPPQAFAELMDRIYLLQVKHGVKLQLYASEGVQPSLFTPEMARRMIRAGFSNITIPMESIEPETLAAFNKPSALSDYHRAVEIAKEAGFGHIGIFIMVGTPQQSLDELVHAIVDCWWRRVSPVLMKYTIIPGSQDWETDAWVHKGFDLHELHPSLWRGAREDLTVLDLEEVVMVARLGYDRWRALPQLQKPFVGASTYRSNTRVEACFQKWCSRYGLLRDGRFRNLETTSPHEPAWGPNIPTREDLLRYSVGQHAGVSMVA